jgi:hypothetical protein
MPASSSPFDHCDCSCDQNDEHEHGDASQPATTGHESGVEQKCKSHGNPTMADVAKMTKKDFMAFIDRVRSRQWSTQCIKATLTWIIFV